ncbi:MAG TPA: S41 family peptidase [Cytophagales bacterium]|jgi:hypothetical protein
MRKILIFFLLILCACKSAFFEEVPPENAPAVFDQLWTEFRSLYGSFAERGVDWQSLRDKYRPRVTSSTSEEDLFRVISAMLAELNDAHVSLVAPNRPVFPSYRVYREKPDDELFDPGLVKKNYLAPGFQDTRSYTYGLIASDILYIRLARINDQTPVLEKIIDQYPGARGMVIDLRHCPGGDFTWSFPALGRFTDSKRLVFSSRTRNGPEPDDFTPWYEWYLEPEGPHYDKPLVVLTDRYTNSAAERTAMALKVLPQATFVGDTTAGGHSTSIGRELQNGWYYTIPPQQTKFADGRSYEGIGLAPDIVLRNDRSRLASGVDDVLERAKAILQ